MKISDLEKKLAEIREREGDLEVHVQSLSHIRDRALISGPSLVWPPEPVVKVGTAFGNNPPPRYLLLNP